MEFRTRSQSLFARNSRHKAPIQTSTTVAECRNLYFALEKAIRPGSVTGGESEHMLSNGGCIAGGADRVLFQEG